MVVEKEEENSFISQTIGLQEIKPCLKAGWIIPFWLRKMHITEKQSHKTENALNLAWKVELSLSVSYLCFIQCSMAARGF